MFSPYCSIWVPGTAVIFQRSTTLSTSQRIKENTEKSSSMDYKNISHLINIGS